MKVELQICDILFLILQSMEIVSGKRVITKDTRKEMKAILNDIQTGKFVRDWMLECKVKQPNFKASRRISKDHQIEVVGKKLREMMPWIQKIN